MIRLRSRMEASLVSMAVAVTPPTRAPGATALSSERICRTAATASEESAAPVSVACSSTSPRTTVGVGTGAPGRPDALMPSLVMVAVPLALPSDTTATLATMGWFSSRSAAVCMLASGTTTMTGLPEPPGKCSPSTTWPSRASEAPRMSSDWGTPTALSCVKPSAPSANTAVVVILMSRGLRGMRRATQAHGPPAGMPSAAATTAGSYFGLRGQNDARPKR